MEIPDCQDSLVLKGPQVPLVLLVQKESRECLENQGTVEQRVKRVTQVSRATKAPLVTLEFLGPPEHLAGRVTQA